MAPEALLGMCRLARIAVLQQWKANIESISVLAQMPNAYNALVLVPSFKERVCRSLEEDCEFTGACVWLNLSFNPGRQLQFGIERLRHRKN